MANFTSNPLEDPALQKKYEVIALDITGLAVDALKDSPLTQREKLRTKNFFALGFTYWVYSRPIEPTIDYINAKWASKAPELADANIRVLKAGYFLGETTETTRNRYMVARAEVEAGTYRKISGNEATALGLLAGAKKAGRDLLFSGYPITPATGVLETLATYKHFGVKTVQAEDEIAAIGVALGASYAGQIGVTATSGPGMCLKSEFIGLAMTTELPLVIINVQRGGPSTGLPTKTEQSDLLQALYGRHGESPLPVVAANSPSDCFRAAFEAVRIALEYSTPVILLSDGYLANGSEPWKIPDGGRVAGDLRALCRPGATLRGLRPRPANLVPHPSHPRPSGTRTPHRWPRKRPGGIGQLRRGKPQRNDPPAGRQGRSRGHKHPAAAYHRRTHAASCSSSDGAAPTVPSPRRSNHCGPRATMSAAPTCVI